MASGAINGFYARLVATHSFKNKKLSFEFEIDEKSFQKANKLTIGSLGKEFLILAAEE